MILFKSQKKSEKVKEDSVENIFPRQKANYEILWWPSMTQEIIPFLCQVLFLWIFHFFPPPLKTFLPNSGQQIFLSSTSSSWLTVCVARKDADVVLLTFFVLLDTFSDQFPANPHCLITQSKPSRLINSSVITCHDWCFFFFFSDWETVELVLMKQ